MTLLLSRHCSLLETGIDIISYADDTVLVFCDSSWNGVRERAENGVYKIKNWLDHNKLSFNITKTSYIAFSLTDINRPNFSALLIPNTSLRILEADSSKYLGVVVDKNLKWSQQISALCNKIRRIIYKFYELRKFMTQGLLLTIYKTLVESVLQYGIIVWGGLYSTALEPLNVIQNYILKVISKRDRLYTTNQLYNANILNVRMLYFHNCCLFIYKNTNIQKPVSHQHNTRQITNRHLTVPFCRRDGNQRFVNRVAPKIFNILPTTIKNLKKYKQFSLKCKLFIFDNFSKCLELL